MAKVLVFQHVPYEPLGLLDPLLREHRHRIRYVNFGRAQTHLPDLENYEALIVLGGPMNIGQEEDFPHLQQEKEAIQQAIQMGMPILGICLGAQLLASALEADVYPANQQEIGWYPVKQTPEGMDDLLIRHFSPTEQIFQWHGYTFDLPAGAVQLLCGDICPNQAFRYGDCAYGIQFHLEVCDSLIERWLTVPAHQAELESLATQTGDSANRVAKIRHDNKAYLQGSNQLALNVFNAFIDHLPKVNRRHVMSSRH